MSHDVVRALSLTPRVRSQRTSASPQLSMFRVLIMCAYKQDNCSNPNTPSEKTAGIVHNLVAASGMPIESIFYQVRLSSILPDATRRGTRALSLCVCRTVPEC